MKKIIALGKKYSNYLKVIFVASVVLIVIHELKAIAKTISFNQLKDIFGTLSWETISLMAIIGLISVVPMLGYDIILTKLLNVDVKKRYLIESSWMINTTNNIVGFGGLISMGLRSQLYGQGKRNKDVIQALSKILLLLMAGLSVYSLLALVLVFFGHTTDYVEQYWPWLLIGALYFPVVFVVSIIKKDDYVGNMTSETRLGLLLTSFLEWTGVAVSFILIGKLMGIHFSTWQILPMFIAASVIGIISLIPGELGSFDVLMILGLSAMGISREQVVAWILLYRLFYYIIPFLVGILLFGRTLSSQLNDRFEGIPAKITSQVSLKIIVFLMYFTGFMLCLSATIPQAFIDHTWLVRFDPFYLPIISQFPLLFMGAAFFMIGRGLSSKIKRAFVPALVVLTLSMLYSVWQYFYWPFVIFVLILFALAFLARPELYRKQLIYSWEMMTKDGILGFGLVILYLIVGFVTIRTHIFHHHSNQSNFFIFPSDKLWFAGLVSIVIIFTFILLLMRYFENKRVVIGDELNDERVLSVLTTYGGNTDSQLVFLNDKRVYFYQNAQGEDTAYLQFAIYRDKCIVMSDPSGDSADFKDLLLNFIQECDVYGYSPIFYEVSESIVLQLHEAGFGFIKMGEDAQVRLQDFTTTGKKKKGLRSVMNQVTKAGCTMEMIHPPFSAETMAELQAVSDDWLGGRTEKGFSLGFFSEDYLQRAPIAVVKDSEGAIVAFANIMPTYTDDTITIDLMRYSSKAPSGIMDYLFISLFEQLRDDNYQLFNLGMAPFSNVGTTKYSFVQERIAFLIYKYGNRFYSFQGLRAYKEKYASFWRPRYTAYSRHDFLAYVMLSLLLNDNRPVTKKSKKKKKKN
ncbi:hypothetical protein CBF34_02605 [Vagococcus penaei]|uniref:Phosphatidylglycerol lysyltransferase n=1 Tax=Vagococcus penaei TaxID=633807 RepID=A0A1Q2D426_9ENTE|nr:bifunctional lysylphosphatidylglycerol flippase/synthetase MprF [Vagococcus penaei]AQP53118.1 hypothetical protein BW732_01985 [Vagococcus penaei]RSU06020.1 hypothetical protein CBF34_02605 [Vagococcus penaei]